MRRVTTKICIRCREEKFMGTDEEVCASCKDREAQATLRGELFSPENHKLYVKTVVGMVVKKNTRPNPTRKLGKSCLTGKKKPSGYIRSAQRRVINPRYYKERSSTDSEESRNTRTDA